MESQSTLRRAATESVAITAGRIAARRIVTHCGGGADTTIRSLAFTVLLCTLPLLATPAHAELVRLEVLSVVPFDGGRAFGSAGPYELVIARAHFAVDPSSPANRGMVDLALAPRDGTGRVVFTADVHLLRPVDPARGNGTLVVEIVNRGGGRALAERDPRASVEERYTSRDDYLERYAEAARALIADGLVLAEDFEDLMDVARRRWAFHERRPALLPGVASAAPGAGGEDR